jgi:hypothetical protein
MLEEVIPDVWKGIFLALFSEEVHLEKGLLTSEERNSMKAL